MNKKHCEKSNTKKKANDYNEHSYNWQYICIAHMWIYSCVVSIPVFNPSIKMPIYTIDSTIVIFFIFKYKTAWTAICKYKKKITKHSRPENTRTSIIIAMKCYVLGLWVQKRSLRCVCVCLPALRMPAINEVFLQFFIIDLPSIYRFNRKIKARKQQII